MEDSHFDEDRSKGKESSEYGDHSWLHEPADRFLIVDSGCDDYVIK